MGMCMCESVCVVGLCVFARWCVHLCVNACGDQAASGQSFITAAVKKMRTSCLHLPGAGMTGLGHQTRFLSSRPIIYLSCLLASFCYFWDLSNYLCVSGVPYRRWRSLA
jgi:hypothetical protein